MSKNAGFWAASATDDDTLTIDITAELGGASISGSPTVTGTNRTAAYVSHSGGAIVCSFEVGSYAGSVQASATLTDGRVIVRRVELRFV